MAITFDQVTSTRNSTGSLSFSVTLGANANFLVVGTSVQDSNHANMPVTSITYNGVALTKVRHDEATGNNRTEIWYLANPATGANTLAVNITGSVGEAAAFAYSFSGVNTSSPADTNNGQTGNGFSPTLSFTTTNNGDFAVSVFSSESTLPGTGTSGYTFVTPLTDQSFENADGCYSTNALSSGSNAVSFDMNSGQSFAQSVFAFVAQAQAAAANSLFSLMGVG